MTGRAAATRVVITGASSGIGAATALAFARHGAHLVLAAQGAAGLENIAARCRAAGGEAQVQTVDVTDAGAMSGSAPTSTAWARRCPGGSETCRPIQRCWPS